MKEEIISTKVFNGKHLDMYVDTFFDKNHKVKEWERCSRKGNSNAVVIIAKHIELDKYILISEFRIPIKDREISFPSGLIEEGETVEDTVKREIKEETGLDLIEILEISPLVYSSAGMTNEGSYVVYANVNGEVSDKFLEPSEDIVPLLVSKEDIKKLIQDRNNKWSVKTWMFCNNLVNQNIFR
jgi:ADP-ribose pyrophosphatase